MIRFILYIYMLALLVDFLLSLFPQYAEESWSKSLKQWTTPACVVVKRLIPLDLPVDFSPLIVIAGLLLIIKLW